MSSKLLGRICVSCLIIFQGLKAEEKLSLFTLNLHGLHPTGEEVRYMRTDNLKYRKTSSHLYYFTPTEIKRSVHLRLKKMNDFFTENPHDIIFFQEFPSRFNVHKKNCADDFYQNNPLSSFLEEKGQLFLACRGNAGWVTNNKTFSKNEVFKKVRQGKFIKVWGKGDNPYPHGVHLEGMAIWVNKKINVLKHWSENIIYNHHQEKVFVEFLKFEKKGRWYLALNIHLGHKIQHLEQGLAIRKRIYELINQSDYMNFGNVFMAGDFNSTDYYIPQQNYLKDLSFLAWAPRRPFNFMDSLSALESPHMARDPKKLYQSLARFNLSTYKSWANIKSTKEADQRIQKIVLNAFELFKNGLFTSFKDSFSPEKCIVTSSRFCHKRSRIDFILALKNIRILSSHFYFNQHNWTDLDNTLSDHPGVSSLIEL